ncbi:Verru_Chthon cassette protein B [Prosthecobacter sp. SYSU 5D2]|uniref:Verru_Chthon cassette protein B n=1 Tax=Prosthecobacter sp. SYSU 5D2 TaxID=3134134 RepID=UPI0031FE964F
MNISLSNLRRHSSRCGFSLVEVVLATGIMALGVVTILGLLPHGLELTRKTANEQAETRIVDQIVGELQTMNWASMTVGQPQIRYFDDQGLELMQPNGDSFKMLLNYVVQVNIPELDVKLPTNDGDGRRQTNQNLRRVMIKMISAPLPEFDFDDPNTTVPIKSFTQLIANAGLVTDQP